MFDPITTNVSPNRVLKKGAACAYGQLGQIHIEMYPDMPTFAEQGFPEMTTSTWVGISGPKGLPSEVVTKLYDELLKLYKAPDVVERFKEVVLLPEDKPMTSAQYTKFVGDFATIWAGVSKQAGISLELG